MTDEDRRPVGAGAPAAPDPDEALASLVREVAGSWSMPPRRIGRRTWRDRIGAERAPSRLLRPALAAIAVATAATVILAFGAVWLAGRPAPSGEVGASAGPGTQASPGPSGAATSSSAASQNPAGPSPTPLPALAIVDPVLRSISFPVQADGHRILDLSKGLDSAPMSDGSGSNVERLLRWGGGTACLCPRAVAGLTSQMSSLTVDLVEFDRGGVVVRSRTVASYTGGLPDARTNGTTQPVAVATSPSGDPNVAYLGWTIRRADGWASGIDIVDLRAARVIQTVRLPSWPLTGSLEGVSGPEARPTFADPPQVFVSPSGARLVVEQVRGAYATGPGGGLGDGVRQAPDHWSAAVGGSGVGALTAFASATGTLDPTSCPWPFDEALVSDNVFVALCSGPPAVLRRVGIDGRPLGDISIGDAAQTAFVADIDAPGGIRYAWLPFAHTLWKIDIIGGRVLGQVEVPSATASAGSPVDGVLGRLGGWLAPSVDAKTYIQPALALSPDGSRLYLLGTTATDFTEANAGSAGIIVVDTASLALTSRWAPTADFISVAVSSDGRYVFAAGSPGVDAAGGAVPGQGGSVTVYRASDGAVAGILGQLGSAYVTFEPALMP